MNTPLGWLTVVAALLLAPLAGAGTNGTYVIQGGSYSIDVEFVPEGLQIVEPNKTSLYTPTGEGVYEFTNPDNGVPYGIRVIDDNTIEAFKPKSGQPGTVLKRSGATAMAVDENDPSYSKYMAIAQKYTALSENDPDNLQVWTACAAAAFSWAHMPADQASQLASQSAMMLKAIMNDTSGTPCDDAIPAALW
jgi:hypothetical protein